MNTTLLKKITCGFFLVYAVLILLGFENLAWYLKPLLIPALMLITFSVKTFPSKNKLFFALLFSWIGDVLLMFAPEHDLFFISGLVSFLTAHLVYIQLLWSTGKIATSSKAYLFLLPFILLYLFAFLSTLWSDLGEMKIPVAFYAAVISCMLVAAFRYYMNHKNLTSLHLLFGAFFFVASDSILAWDKFYQTLPLGSFLIMSTYLAAQYMLVAGFTGKEE
jgi:uncharacterized membrane protein YhhN